MAVSMKDGVQGKRCSKCREWKPLADFYTDASHGPSQGGRHCRCKVCQREDHKARFAATKRLTSLGLIQGGELGE